jgi:hypothetical protein
MTKTLTKIQEVYFDLCDILDNNDFSEVKLEGCFDFETLEEFLIEQRNKLSEIETAIDLERA